MALYKTKTDILDSYTKKQAEEANRFAGYDSAYWDFGFDDENEFYDMYDWYYCNSSRYDEILEIKKKIDWLLGIGRPATFADIFPKQVK